MLVGISASPLRIITVLLKGGAYRTKLAAYGAAFLASPAMLEVERKKKADAEAKITALEERLAVLR